MTPAGQTVFLEKHHCLASFLPSRHVLLLRRIPPTPSQVLMAEVGEGKGLGRSGEGAS